MEKFGFGFGFRDKHPGSACFCVHKTARPVGFNIYKEEETALDPCSFYEDRVPGFFLNLDPQPDFF